jgi:hypothetical protein
MTSPRPSHCSSLATLAPALAVLLAAAACGSSKDSSGDAGPEALGCNDPDPGVLDYIDNMEDGDYLVLMRDGRNGGWYTYADDTAGTINPPRSMEFPMESIPEPRCGTSTKAMRVTGSGFTDWGSGFGMSMRTVLTNGVYHGGPYDATTARGVAFWARAGESSITTVRVNVVDSFSSGESGLCDPAVPSGDAACYDHFGDSVVLTTQWKRYVLMFNMLQQRNFGRQRTALDLPTIMNLEFNMAAGASVFDIWIDDPAFVR